LGSFWSTGSKANVFFTPFLCLWSWDINCSGFTKTWLPALSFSFHSIWRGEIIALLSNGGFLIGSLMLPRDELTMCDLVDMKHH
jgi:hypothetical protein